MVLTPAILLGALACSSGTHDPIELPQVIPEARRERQLSVLEATSGTGVERVIDLDSATSWTPVPDPSEEGVWMSFDAAIPISAVLLEGCPIHGSEVELFADGSSLGRAKLDEGRTQFLFPPQGVVQTLYLRMLGPVGVCLSEITLTEPDQVPLTLIPPRRVSGVIEVSSVLQPEAAYRAAYLFDGRPHFAWAEGGEGTGAGERLHIGFDTPQRVSGIEIWNGYQRSSEHFEKNARLAKIRVMGEGETPYDLDLLDRDGPQMLSIDPPIDGISLSIEVLEVFAGSRYADLAISELRFRDDRGLFRLQTRDLPLAEAALRKELRGSPLEQLLGRTLESYCVPRTATLKLRRDASFVWYTSSGEHGSSSAVFDGAWAIERKEGPWVKVSLYGRRHDVPQGWQPNIDPNTTKTPQLSSGVLEIALARDLGPQLEGELKALGRLASPERVSCAIEGDLRDLATSGAILVKGAALTDLFVPQSGN